MQKQVALISRLAGQDGADLAEYLISLFHANHVPCGTFVRRPVCRGNEARDLTANLGGHDGRCSI